MRKVLFTENEDSVPTKKGYFHGWTKSDYRDVVLAIIEDETGNIMQLMPYKIKFEDRPE